MISYDIGNVTSKSKYLKIEMIEGQLLGGDVGPTTRQDNESGTLEAWFAPANVKADPQRAYWYRARNVIVGCDTDADIKYRIDGAPGKLGPNSRGRDLNGIGTILEKTLTEIEIVDSTPSEESSIRTSFQDASRFFKVITNQETGMMDIWVNDFEVAQPPFGDLVTAKAPNYTNCNFVNKAQRKMLFFFKTNIPQYLLPLFGDGQLEIEETFDCQGDILFKRTVPSYCVNMRQTNENYGALPTECRLVWDDGTAWIMTTLDFIPNTGEMIYNFKITTPSPFYKSPNSEIVDMTSKIQIMNLTIISTNNGGEPA